MKEGLKDFGFFVLLELLFAGFYVTNKSGIYQGFDKLLEILAEQFPTLSNLSLSNEAMTWIVASLLIPLSAAIPYHFRLVREVNKYKGEGLVKEVTKTLAEFRGELESFRRILDDVAFEQNNLRQKLELLRKTFPRLDEALKQAEKEEVKGD